MRKEITAVIDYQAGNLHSVAKALRASGAEVEIVTEPEGLRHASRVVLPGVGHFSSTERLRSSGMDNAVRERVAAGAPFLGICVGLQWLFQGSTEAPEVSGLGIFPGLCDRFPPDVKSPHVGWNSLEVSAGSRLLAGLPESAYVYFTHSYRGPIVQETTATTEYGGSFSAAVERGNWMAVQFHPEKSGDAGRKVLENFLGLPGC
jgi:glutamine amidotransferase